MLDLSSFTPHGFCLAWEPGLIWLQAGSDLAIALAYYTIPLALLSFARRRRDLAFPWVFRLFAAFILACGTTHILGVLTLWWPIYWTDAALKLVTALLSVTTAAALWPLLPRALSIPSQVQLQDLNQRLSVEVADRRAAEAQLRASEARLKAIYARTPAPLCAADRTGHVIEASDQWLELLGLSRREVIGQRLASFHTAGTRPRAEQDWAALQEQGALRDVEQTLHHRDGSDRLVLTSATLDGSGAAVLAMTDITARREMEQALQASEAHLRQAQKMEAVGHLTGGIAHDFNNMLTAIMCVMELLQKRLPDTDPSRALVTNVLDVAQRGARLTGQLLAFSRRQRLVPEALSPIEVAHDMHDLLTRSLGEHVALEIAPIDPGSWLALADRNQLEAALLNLVLNAKQADARSITIGAAAMPQAGLSATAEASREAGEEPLPVRDYVAITVSDDGAGMSEETRRRAFEPFFTTKPVGQGSGLGLSQAYGFARQSGGTVRLESRPGGGTRVSIILPRTLSPEERSKAELAAPLPARPGDGQQVMVVEDEDTLREVLVAALHDQGYRVTAARSGDEAVELVEGGATPDVLFTDIVMPGIRNGVDMAMELRRRLPNLPVLFATGYSDRRVLDRWTDGKPRVLAKPYSIAEVFTALGEVAIGARARSDNFV